MPEERTPEQQELVRFLRIRWKHIKETNNYFRVKISEDERANYDQMEAKRITQEAYLEWDRYAENVLFRTNGFVTLIAVCTFLEEVAREFVLHFGGIIEDVTRGSGSDITPCIDWLKKNANPKFDSSKVQKEID